mgnify:CR=1 FL=1
MFLEKFTFPSEDSELQFQYGCEELLKTCYNSTYPFGVFTYRELPPFEFEPITVSSACLTLSAMRTATARQKHRA